MSYQNTIQQKTAPSTGDAQTPQPANQQQDASPRLIASKGGDILFSNAAFIELCHFSSSIEGENIKDLFSFQNTSFQNSNVDIKSGLHQVTLLNNQSNLSLQFDWVYTAGGQKFLVVSAEKITAREKLQQYVTDKIEEKKNLQLNNSAFASLSFDAHVTMKLDAKFSSINKNLTGILGYTSDDIIGKSLFDITHPNQQKELSSTIQHLIEDANNTSILSLELCCISKEADLKWIEWNFQRIDDVIHSIGRDITSIKHYKFELQQQYKKLTEAEAIGHIGQWRWKVGADLIEFSDQLFSIYGVKSGAFEPTLESVNNMIHRQDAGRMTQVFQRAIIEQNNYDMDFRIIRPDGEIRYVRCEGRCETDSEDDVIALYGIMQDVTETTRRELDLREAKESVERAYAAKTQFLANMSHELRTPLNAIIGFSEMIEQQILGPIGTKKYLEYAGGIRESGEHLLDLISDILDMSKIEAGKYELSLEKFNIAKVIRMAVRMMEGRALDANIKININIPDEALDIIADRRAIMQTLLNILSNAVKFSKQSGNVDLSIIQNDEYFSICVEDEGIGIPANKIENITLPFEQAETDYTREYKGSGLGLAITKELTEMHGGSLHIESSVGIGTKVTLRLPYEAQNAQISD